MQNHIQTLVLAIGASLLVGACVSKSAQLTVLDATNDRPIPSALVYGRQFMLSRPPVAAITSTDEKGVATFSAKMFGQVANIKVFDIASARYYPVSFSGNTTVIRLVPLPASEGHIRAADVDRRYRQQGGTLLPVFDSITGSVGSLKPNGLWELDYALTADASELKAEWEIVRRSYVRRGLSKTH